MLTKFKKKVEDTKSEVLLERELRKLYLRLAEIEYDSQHEEYASLIKTISQLTENRTKYEDAKKLSKGDILAAATSIGGLLIVLNYEKIGVVTSKAFGMIKKGK